MKIQKKNGGGGGLGGGGGGLGEGSVWGGGQGGCDRRIEVFRVDVNEKLKFF